MPLCTDHTKKDTPRYTGKVKPRTDCEKCWDIYNSIPHASTQRERRALGSSAAPIEAPAPKRVVEALEQQLAAAQGALSLYDREWTSAPGWLNPEDAQERHGTLVVMLSDPHWGEVVDPREMNDYNAYNLAIADGRMKRFFERTILVARSYLAGVLYDGIILALGGDLVSGDIHEELTETNECTTNESVEWAVPRLKAGLETWAEEFGQVHVVSAPGNHGRRTAKPRHKKRSADNADTHIARLLAGSFPEGGPITFNIPRSMDAEFVVYGRRFSVEHGDAFKGGDGQVGAYGPAKRGTMRKLTQAQAEGKPLDYLLVGHFHQYIPAASQQFVMNGSVKGYDEYARTWHFKPEPAQQALMVCTPEHGITVQAPVLVQSRSKEGW